MILPANLFMSFFVYYAVIPVCNLLVSLSCLEPNKNTRWHKFASYFIRVEILRDFQEDECEFKDPKLDEHNCCPRLSLRGRLAELVAVDSPKEIKEQDYYASGDHYCPKANDQSGGFKRDECRLLKQRLNKESQMGPMCKEQKFLKNTDNCVALVPSGKIKENDEWHIFKEQYFVEHMDYFAGLDRPMRNKEKQNDCNHQDQNLNENKCKHDLVPTIFREFDKRILQQLGSELWMNIILCIYVANNFTFTIDTENLLGLTFLGLSCTNSLIAIIIGSFNTLAGLISICRFNSKRKYPY